MKIHSKSAAVLAPRSQYVRQRELLDILPFSSATLWRKVRSGTFIKPVKLSERITAWNRTEVQAWLAAKESK